MCDRRSRFGALTLLLAGAAGGIAAAAEDRPAVELYNPMPRFPRQAADAQVAPEVTVELVVDELGKVDEVRVVEVRPSGELDFLFEEAVIETLSTWRYAPRVDGGVPVPTTLRFTLRVFEPGVDRSRRMSDEDWWNSVLGVDPGSDRRFRTLTLQERKKLLEEQVRIGLELLGAGATRTISDSFVVHTDAAAETGGIVVSNLEAAYALLSALLGDGIPLEPEELKLPALVFSSDEAFHAFRFRTFPSETLFSGIYSGLGLIAFHLEAASSEDVLAVLLHEVTHAFVDRHLVRPGVTLPVWLTEGLAEYIGNSRVEEGKLVPGRIRRAPSKHYAMEQGEVVTRYGGLGVAATLDDIRRAARRGQALTLAEMLDADRETFYGEARRFYYGASGLLVHFLRHGRPEWAEDAFRRFLLYVAEGFPPSAALEAAYGSTVEELEEPYRLHLAES